MAFMTKKHRTVMVVLLTFLATCALVLLALNFTAGEKKIQHQIARLYNSADPQFERAMGLLLGPGLLNGDQIFPPMLQAIRGARTSITFETYIYWSGRCRPPFWTTGSRRLAA